MKSYVLLPKILVICCVSYFLVSSLQGAAAATTRSRPEIPNRSVLASIINALHNRLYPVPRSVIIQQAFDTLHSRFLGISLHGPVKLIIEYCKPCVTHFELTPHLLTVTKDGQIPQTIELVPMVRAHPNPFREMIYRCCIKDTHLEILFRASADAIPLWQTLTLAITPDGDISLGYAPWQERCALDSPYLKPASCNARYTCRLLQPCARCSMYCKAQIMDLDTAVGGGALIKGLTYNIQENATAQALEEELKRNLTL